MNNITQNKQSTRSSQINLKTREIQNSTCIREIIILRMRKVNLLDHQGATTVAAR